ncbi:hypothetical protein N1851_031154 [Merluccius polli]|uniref:Uncharacterized protein n=1 Tax=Merluccius polli TaxID=89951 RepID=A0AA47NPD3_MERPO|nr:hypothetical protein N1851_031154 [Merluccius polli]
MTVTYFTKKVKAISSSLTPTTILPTTTPTYVRLTHFTPLFPEDVHKLVMSNHATTCPLDPIPSSLFQAVSSDILPFLTPLINSSLTSGLIPASFKIASFNIESSRPSRNLPLTLLTSRTIQTARLVFNLPKFSHVTPLFRDLHWLPVAACIRFKTMVLTYKAVNGTAPTYLQALVRPPTPARALRATTMASRLVPLLLLRRLPLLFENEIHCYCNSTCLMWRRRVVSVVWGERGGGVAPGSR